MSITAYHMGYTRAFEKVGYVRVVTPQELIKTALPGSALLKILSGQGRNVTLKSTASSGGIARLRDILSGAGQTVKMPPGTLPGVPANASGANALNSVLALKPNAVPLASPAALAKGDTIRAVAKAAPQQGGTSVGMLAPQRAAAPLASPASAKGGTSVGMLAPQRAAAPLASPASAKGGTLLGLTPPKTVAGKAAPTGTAAAGAAEEAAGFKVPNWLKYTGYGTAAGLGGLGLYGVLKQPAPPPPSPQYYNPSQGQY